MANTPQQIRDYLAYQGWMYQPGGAIPEVEGSGVQVVPSGFYRFGEHPFSNLMSLQDISNMYPDISVADLEQSLPLFSTPASYAKSTPSRGGGFFSMLTDLVTSPPFLMAASVVAPSLLAAEAAGAAAAAAPAANAGAGLIDASLGQAYADLGIGAGAPAAGATPSVVTQPIATSPLATMGAPTPMLAADLAAYNALAPGLEAADVAGTAINNMLMPTATTGAIPSYSTGLTSSGLSNFIDPFNPLLPSYTSPFAPPTAGVGGVALSPEALAALDAGLGGVPASAAGTAALSPEALAALDAGLGGVPASAATGAGAAGAGAVAPALNFEQIAAESLGANVPGVAEGVSGSSVFTPATAATTAATNALAPALNHEQIAAESLGANLPGAATGVAGAATAAGLSTGAFDTLAKFAKDYGVPLASLISGITGSQAAQSAAETQARSAAEARQLARDIFNEQKALQEPFRTAGITAQNQLLTLLGLPGGTQGAEFGRYARPFGMQDFQADPGYAFRLSEGLKALEASRAAKGGLLSGATGKALSRYGQDLASQEYGNAFNRYQTERANRLAPLGSLMSSGQAAAAGQAGYAGQYGQTAGGLTTDIGAVRAAGDIGAARAISNALSAYGNYMGNQNLAQAIRESQYNR